MMECDRNVTTDDNVICSLYSDDIKRYWVGILVLMIGVITPFT